MSTLLAKMFFSLLGALALAVGIRGFLVRRKTSAWPSVEGEVLESAVQGIDDDFVSVKYAYTVCGRAYRGDRYSLVGGSDANAPEIVERLRPGTRVRVLYDPEDPSRAALERGSVAGPGLLVAVGAAFLLFSSVFPWAG